MFLRRLAIVGAACACVSVLAGSTAIAAGEEIVVETSPMTPSSPDQWIDYSVSRRLDAWLVGNATCLKLVDFDEVTGALTPDAATGMPAVSPDGKTYTFTIAAGHRFEGGPAEAVTAESFKRALERATSPAMAATVPYPLPAREFVGAIVGAAAFFDGSAGSISGVQASGNTLTIELLAANPTFLYQLAMPYFCATQSDAPAGFFTGALRLGRPVLRARPRTRPVISRARDRAAAEPELRRLAPPEPRHDPVGAARLAPRRGLRAEGTAQLQPADRA